MLEASVNAQYSIQVNFWLQIHHKLTSIEYWSLPSVNADDMQQKKYKYTKIEKSTLTFYPPSLSCLIPWTIHHVWFRLCVICCLGFWGFLIVLLDPLNDPSCLRFYHVSLNEPPCFLKRAPCLLTSIHHLLFCDSVMFPWSIGHVFANERRGSWKRKKWVNIRSQ